MISPILPLFLLLVILCFLGYLVVKHNWYFQALIVITGIIGAIASVIGLHQVSDRVFANDKTGIFLLAIGLITLLGDAILVMKSKQEKISNEQPYTR